MHKSKTHKNRNKTVCAQRLTHTISHARTHTKHTRSYRTHSSRTKRERENKRDVLAHFAQLQRATRQTHSNCYSSRQWVKLAPTPKHKNQTVCTNWPLPPQARSLSRRLSRTLFYLSCSPLLSCCTAAASSSVHPLATRCICCSSYLQLPPPPPYTLFLPKIPFNIDYWFSFSPMRALSLPFCLGLCLPHRWPLATSCIR